MKLSVKKVEVKEVLQRSLFMKKDTILDVEMPTGRYKIKWATGKIWYGPEILFGPSTVYYESKETLSFTYNKLSYQGYELTLSKGPHGNMESNEIDKSKF